MPARGMSWFDRLIMGRPKRLPKPGKQGDSKLVPWKYHTFGPRLGAGFIDGLVLMPFGALFLFLLRDSSNLPSPLFLLIYAINSSIYLVYSIVLHGKFGQTVGKMAMKVKVLSLDESPLGMRRALLRDAVPVLLMLTGLIWKAPLILKSGSLAAFHEAPHDVGYYILSHTSWVWFCAEVLTMMASAKRRALHDFIAGSVVVKVQALEAAKGKRPPIRTPGMPARTISPLTLAVIVALGVSALGGLKLFGHTNPPLLVLFEDMYSDRQIAQNLQSDGFVEPARSSLTILADRRSPLGKAKATALLADKHDWFSGAMYLAALGHKESIPYLIRALGESPRKRSRKYYEKRVSERLKSLTGKDFGTDAKAWEEWWNKDHPTSQGESPTSTSAVP